MSGFIAVGAFLVSLVFGIVILLLWLRIALRFLKISTLSPLGQVVHTLTNPVINPINNLLKLKYKPGQLYDWTAFGVLVLVEILKIICLSLLVFKGIIPIPYVLLYVLADLIIQPCDLLFYAILIRVIMSFINPGWQHPIADFLRKATEPLLRFGRKIIPVISGFDFSPFVIIVLLKVITLFISSSLPGRLL